MSDLLEMRAERLGRQRDWSDTELEMRLGNRIWRKRGAMMMCIQLMPVGLWRLG